MTHRSQARKGASTPALWLWIGLLLCILIHGTPRVASAAQAGSEPPVDLIFVIDNSGSMRKNDPQFVTPKVVQAFVHRLPGQARVGMVLFDQTIRLLEPLDFRPTGEARERLTASLAKIDYKGRFTNSAVGIERALYELKVNGRPEARRGIVFITDGIVDTGSASKDQELNQWLKQDLTAESKSLGVRIFGIALTEAADFILIQALATRTGGEYYRTATAAEIATVLDNILSHLTPPVDAPSPVPATSPASVRDTEVQSAAPPAAKVPAPAAVPAFRENAPAPAAAPRFGPWYFWALGMTVPLMAAAIAFLIVAYRKKTLVPPAAATPRQPEAHLEDLSAVLGQGTPLIAIAKARTTIGRDARNDIAIPKPTISSFHATIECKNMVFYLEDQRSTNGTRLNDRKLAANMPVRLKGGDRITLAAFAFKFVLPDQIPFGETLMVSMTALEGPESGSTMIIDLNGEEGERGLITCLQSHLLQLYAMGPRHREFVGHYFNYDTLAIIAAKAHQNLKKTHQGGDQYCAPIVQGKAFYLVCSLPVTISGAADWYGMRYGGFTQFIMKWIKSPAYQAAQCDRLCVVTFGQDPATWVSLTIVPTLQETDPVEIMSVDFLNEAEKAMLALDFDRHGRVM
jgi:pSer/pThr/pTyr-binding forkhead associated (FHA) protein/Mg-chelatase subunit ChlD